MADFSRYGWTPPDPDKSDEAWERGLEDGRHNRPRLEHAYTDKTLQGDYAHGYARGIQLALQARYGDPPTSGQPQPTVPTTPKAASPPFTK